MWGNVSKELRRFAFLHCSMHKDTFGVNQIHLCICNFHNIELATKTIYCDTPLATTTLAFPFLLC